MKKLVLVAALVGAALGPAMVLAADVLPPDVAARLAFMREEEKLAHDVYLLFDTQYQATSPGTNIFGRIAESEERHTEAVLSLLVKYGLPDPAQPDAGVFLDPGLQALYDTLVAIGQQGATEALGVGVTIEQKDMTDIVEAIEISAEYADIVQVYSNLLSGSESHLAAFLKALDGPAASAAKK